MKALSSVVTLWAAVLGVSVCQYDPTWESLDARPLPAWYDEAKFGVFINWGLYSVPSFGSEWFWWYWQGTTKSKDVVEFMAKNYRPGFTYADFGPMFTAEFYDPNEWVDIIKASGARYIVFSSKHHEGFTTYPSKVSFNWNSKDVGAGRDLLGELADALRNKSDIKFGVYHSLFEWFNPLFKLDKQNKFQTRLFAENKAIPELYELIYNYRPEVVWSDGDWDATDTYWKSKEFLAWLFNESPVKDTVVVNDRWGSGDMCKHGSFYTCSDRYNPGKLIAHKWENCMTIDSGSWGYRRNAQLADYLEIAQLVQLLAETVSCGGNLLMNIGPTHDGRIVPIYEERLRQMGSWLKVNGEAIYGTKPWKCQNDTVTPGVWYTSSRSEHPTVFAIVLQWPDTNVLRLGSVTPTENTTVSLLGYGGAFTWFFPSGRDLSILIPPISLNDIPCQWAWVFKIQNMA